MSEGGLIGRKGTKVDGPFPQRVPGRLPDSDLGKMNEFLDLNLLESFRFPAGSDHKRIRSARQET